jgi:hypothetical protein
MTESIPSGLAHGRGTPAPVTEAVDTKDISNNLYRFSEADRKYFPIFANIHSLWSTNLPQRRLTNIEHSFIKLPLELFEKSNVILPHP